MNLHRWIAVAVWLTLSASAVAAENSLPKYGVFEQKLEQSGEYVNPYTEVRATAMLTGPDGATERLPLYWDGGRTWRFRYSPARTGAWKWSVESNDTGIDGQTGGFEVVDSDRPGGIQPMKGHPHHLPRQNGEPFWFMGDTGWALYTDNEAERHDWPAVRRYTDARAKQGFNVIHSMLISEAGWGNSGGQAFSDLEDERINPAYWQEVDRRLAYLNEQGIVAGLVLAWADKGRNPNNWRDFPSLDARRRYARYVAARYGAMDVYFSVAGEWDFDIRASGQPRDEVKREYVLLGETVDAADPHGRMIAIHNGGGRPDHVQEFADLEWMDFGAYHQNYVQLHEIVLQARRRNAKPVVNSEYAYYLRDSNEDGKNDKPNSATLAMIRHAPGDIAMAGGYFITGFGTTYFGGNRMPGPFRLDDPRNDDWEGDVGHLRTLFADLEWWKLQPHDEIVTAAVPRGKDRRELEVGAPPKTAYWALAEPGRQYAVYVRGCASPLTIDMGRMAANEFRARQFDPRTGEFQPVNLEPAAGKLRYQPPDAQDWVLVITRS